MDDLLYMVAFLLLLAACREGISIKDEERFDCFPEASATPTDCGKRGCIWVNVTGSGANPGIPRCIYKSKVNYGYEAKNNSTDMRNGGTIYLSRSNTLPENGIFTKPIKNISLTVKYHTRSALRITIKDATKKRFEVPVQKQFSKADASVKSPLYKFTHNTTNSYSFKVNRDDGASSKSIFDTSVGALVMSDQFLQISAKLDTAQCYGFGEHEHKSFVLDFNWKKLGMFSRDQPPTENGNLYGVHPFYLCLEKDGKAHGVLMLNSNAMDVTLQPTPAITFRTIGGILDFFFFLGPTPADVIDQYTGLIGRPFMPPYWSLGFQLCRYGYNSLAKVKETIARMKKYDIPQDVQYGDIDYMERQLDFTINPKTYNGLPDYVRELKKDGIRYITILDPAISANETAGTYEAYDLGQKLDIWIKDSQTGKALFGKVWPDLPNITVDESKDWDFQTKHYRAYAVFPDFTHPNISKYWGKLVTDFHKTIEYDGIWIDMNEPANFVHGSVNGCPMSNSYESPPYKPAIFGGYLKDKTVCMTAKNWDGKLQYDMHSLFGWSQTEPTYHATAKGTGKRPLVISRSTYPSSGAFTGHWLGDNTSIWPHMKSSIIGMLEFGLFGIPYIGADICGFFQDTTFELCDRWMALGAFYPFSRNHNGKNFKEQDPGYFGAKFANRSRDVLRIRYNLLPYLYTLFYDSVSTGAPIVRPLFFEFVGDKKTWNIDEQFMWGNALLISPILRQNQNTSISLYLPMSRWYDYHTGKEMQKKDRGSQVSLKVTKDHLIHLHVRGGTIMPTQDPANNTMFSRKNPMGLIVALDESRKANGSLFWDDGDTAGTITNGKFQHIMFKATHDSLHIAVSRNGYTDARMYNFEHVTVLGTDLPPSKAVPYIYNNKTLIKGANGVVDENGALKISGLKLPLMKAHVIQWRLKKVDSGSYQVMSSCIVFLLCLFLSLEL